MEKHTPLAKSEQEKAGAALASTPVTDAGTSSAKSPHWPQTEQDWAAIFRMAAQCPAMGPSGLEWGGQGV